MHDEELEASTSFASIVVMPAPGGEFIIIT